jgi:hypothetical protein
MLYIELKSLNIKENRMILIPTSQNPIIHYHKNTLKEGEQKIKKRMLHLGCGKKIKLGFINVDNQQPCDIIMDLNKFPYLKPDY